MRRVAIHVDSLVIEGVERLDRHAFEERVGRALTEMIGREGWPDGWGTSGRLEQLQLTYQTSPSAEGDAAQQVAKLLYQGGSA